MLQCKTPLKPYPVNSATYLEMSGQVGWMQPDVGGGKNLEFHFLLWLASHIKHWDMTIRQSAFNVSAQALMLAATWATSLGYIVGFTKLPRRNKNQVLVWLLHDSDRKVSRFSIRHEAGMLKCHQINGKPCMSQGVLSSLHVTHYYCS